MNMYVIGTIDQYSVQSRILIKSVEKRTQFLGVRDFENQCVINLSIHPYTYTYIYVYIYIDYGVLKYKLHITK